MLSSTGHRLSLTPGVALAAVTTRVAGREGLVITYVLTNASD